MKRITTKPDGDCTGIGKWMFWVIIGLVLAAWAAMALKSKGQGVGVGALVGAKQPTIVPQLSPAAASVPGVDPGPGDPCEGDTGPTVDLSDSIIVTTGGTAGGTGTQANPLSLTAALEGTGIMATTTNRTVLVRAGTYNAPPGGFKCRLVGSAASPWLIRNYPGESPRIHGPTTGDANARCIMVGDTGTVPRFFTLRGLRMHNTVVTKRAAGMGTNSAGIRLERGTNSISIEHCIFDNNFGTGVDFGSQFGAPLSLKYNLIMLNGGDDNKRHGAYLHSYQGLSNIIEGNIMINNSGYALHCYSSHNSVGVNADVHVNNQKITRNILRKSNNLSPMTGGPLALLKESQTGSGNVVSNNVFSSVSENSGSFGRCRVENNSGLVIRSNYFQRCALTWQINGEDNQFHFNRVVGGDSGVMRLDLNLGAGGSGDGFTLDDNRYDLYHSSGTAWWHPTTPRTFAGWKTSTGQDAGSTGNTTNPTDTSRFIFQSTVDTNVIHFAILNEGASATQTIDFAGYWPACGTITIRNAGHYDATPIVNGVPYTGQTFTITMSSAEYQKPLDESMGQNTASLEFFAGIAVRTPANPVPTQP